MQIVIDDETLEDLINAADHDTLERAFGHLANALEEVGINPHSVL